MQQKERELSRAEDQTMAQQDAQKSEVHETTGDATSSPASANRAAGSAGGPGRNPDARSGRSAPGSRRDASPPSNFERGAADKDIELTREAAGTTPSPVDPGEIGGGPGAGDASSGGGAGAGIPGGGTDMRTDGAFDGGDPDADRRKIFPGTAAGDRPGDARVPLPADGAGAAPKGELKATHIESDESDFGGPIKIQADKIPASGKSS